jgi:hypothetical protein
MPGGLPSGAHSKEGQERDIGTRDRSNIPPARTFLLPSRLDGFAGIQDPLRVKDIADGPL